VADEERSNGSPALPIAVTVLACAAFLALVCIPIPGLPPDASAFAPQFTFGSLGLSPIFAAFILVELVAVAVPSLRPLRDNAEGRIRLRRIALQLALLFAVAQAFGMVRYAQSVGLFAPRALSRPAAVDFRLSIAISLPLGVLAMVALAALIDVAGVGVGYSLLIASGWAFFFGQELLRAARSAPTEMLLRFLLPLGIFAVASWRMLAARPYSATRARYRLPAPGLEPVHQGVVLAFVMLQTDAARRFFWPLMPASVDRGWVWRAMQILLTIGFCALLTRLFHRPATPEDRAALARATRASTLWLAGLTMGSWLVDDAARGVGSGAGSAVFSVVALIAVGMDLALELRTGRQRAVRVLHRLEHADALAAALRSAGIEPALRGAHHRALYHFFAPFIPVSVLVPERDFERAEVVALDHERAIAAPPPMPASHDEGALAPN
jgi:SecY translocase